MPVESLRENMSTHTAHTKGRRIPETFRGRKGKFRIEDNARGHELGRVDRNLYALLVSISRTNLYYYVSGDFNMYGHFMQLTVYSAALRVVGMAICLR